VAFGVVAVTSLVLAIVKPSLLSGAAIVSLPRDRAALVS